jgi:multidrug efflux pump subunit AcrA (membrane-fusion protein)
MTCLRCLPLLALLAAGCAPPPLPPRTEAVREGPFFLWAGYEGRLDARRVELIKSSFDGGAVVTWIAPEGQAVAPGDLLVEFDSSAVSRELVRLERDATLAESDLSSLENGKLPLERRELELKRLEAESALQTERLFLRDSEDLLTSELVSPQEIEQQRHKVAELQSRSDSLQQQIDLTTRFLHPAALDRARATRDSAAQALRLAREQLAACRVLSPAAGVVVHRALFVNNEFRVARVGDTLYKNQVFMAIPDLQEMIAECQVPEAEIGRAQPGAEALLTPVALPDVRLKGRVERVGATAQSLPSRPGWQKYFTVLIALEDRHPNLRPEMSVYCQVLAYAAEAAVIAPRSALRWEEAEAVCEVLGPTGVERRPVKPGRANAREVEILEGLRPGEAVVVP